MVQLRLPYTKSLWRNLHLEEVGEASFTLIDYNLGTLKLAQKKNQEAGLVRDIQFTEKMTDKYAKSVS